MLIAVLPSLVDNIHHLGRFVGGWLANLTFLAAFSTGRLTDSMSTKSTNRTTLPITTTKNSADKNQSYWRWLRDVEDTLCYKNMRLFRQDRIGDWSKFSSKLVHRFNKTQYQTGYRKSLAIFLYQRRETAGI